MGTKPPSGPQPSSTTRAGAGGSEARTNGQTAASQRSSGVTGPQPTLLSGAGGCRWGRWGPVPCCAHGYTDAPPGWWREFILASPARTAKLAVVRADGSPHVAPVWVDLDGDQIVFMTSADTVKGRAIVRDPRVSLCWDDERPPFSFVTIAGTAATSADAGDL